MAGEVLIAVETCLAARLFQSSVKPDYALSHRKPQQNLGKPPSRYAVFRKKP